MWLVVVEIDAVKFAALLRILVLLQSSTSGRRQASSHGVAYLYRAVIPALVQGLDLSGTIIPTSTFHDRKYTCHSSVIATPSNCTPPQHVFHSIIHYGLVYPRHTKVTQVCSVIVHSFELAIELLHLANNSLSLIRGTHIVTVPCSPWRPPNAYLQLPPPCTLRPASRDRLPPPLRHPPSHPAAYQLVHPPPHYSRSATPPPPVALSSHRKTSSKTPSYFDPVTSRYASFSANTNVKYAASVSGTTTGETWRYVIRL
jgi:hypothetical protein